MIDVSLLRRELAELTPAARQLDPDREQLVVWLQAVVDHVLENVSLRRSAPAYAAGRPSADGVAITEQPADIDQVLAMFTELEASGINQASGRHFGFIPGGGLFPAALGDLLADAANPYVGIHFAAPLAADIERSLLRWLAGLVGYPETAGGDLTSGASLATLEAVVTARDAADITSRDVARSVVYLTEQAHHCIEKALRITGLGECVVRQVDIDDRRRMKAENLEQAIVADREAGLNPWLVVATAGTISAGAVDPLAAVAEIADTHGLWLHVDAAYGGFFLLTDYGRRTLRGIERSRTVVMDPHKGLFLPFGSGALLVREERQLASAHRYSATYLSDARAAGGAFSASDLSVELSRPFRGPRVWLPLALFGLAPFRAALQEKLLLARYFHAELSALDGWEVGPEPDLSVVTYRYLPRRGDANEFNRRLLEGVLADGRAVISATDLDGNYTLRLAVLHYRTHLDDIDLLLELLLDTAQHLQAT
jgi:aromatic-L-amino-acid/L-tryptophan decarboxylase